MAKLPTENQVLAIKGDVMEYMAEGKTLTGHYLPEALKALKLDLLNMRNIRWSMLYDDSAQAYLDKSDDPDLNNESQIHRMLILLALAMIFEDTSNAPSDQWWELAQEYRDRYGILLKQALLDVDWDESGVVSSDEEEHVVGGAKLVRH